MIIGIEQSTDLRDRRTALKKFSSVKAAEKWKNHEDNGKLTHGEHAEVQRNYHHSFRTVYEVDARRITKSYINKLISETRHSIYQLSTNDAKARIIQKIGVELLTGQDDYVIL
jgi:hypothetical protein